MSDPIVQAGEPTITLDPNAGKAPEKPAEKQNSDERPVWLDARLERERAKVLKDMGVDSVEAGKAKIAAANAQEDAKKSEAQKAAEFESQLRSTKAERDQMASVIGTYAKNALSGLTDAQRNAVMAVAGEDAGLQLKTIEALKPTWAESAPAAAPVASPPKDTAPPPAAPKDGAPAGAPPDPWATFKELLAVNPVVAARFAEANGLLK